ncbi:MAG: type II secretion system protein GspL [Oceanicoccus sp.]
MNNQLVIRLREIELTPSSEVDWVLFDGSGQYVCASSSPLDHVRQYASNEVSDFSVVVIVPGEAVNLLSPSIPSKQLKQIKQALPFMVEELIADDIENVHIAMPEHVDGSEGVVDVAVISHATLINWLDQLHSSQLSPDSIISDVLCMPFHRSELSLLLDGKRVMMRSGKHSGLVLQIEDFGFLFGNWLSQYSEKEGVATKPVIHITYSSQSNNGSSDSHDDESTDRDEERSSEPEVVTFVRQNYQNCEVKVNAYHESITEILASSYSNNRLADQLNLLQGGYAVSRSGDSNWRNWRALTSVVVIGLLTYLLLVAGSGWYFDNKADSLDAEAVTLYKQLFPNERRIVSPKKQMQNHLRMSGAGNDSHFLPILASLATTLAGDGDEMKLTVDQLRFDTASGELQFQVRSSSIEKLDQLKRELAEIGLEVDINSATEQDDYVMGRLVVRRL